MRILAILLLSIILRYLTIIVMSIKAVLSKEKINANMCIEDVDFALVKEINHVFYEEITEKMAIEGFVKSGDYVYIGNYNIYTRILKNFSENLILKIDQSQTTIIVQFQTIYHDGFQVVTTNYLQPFIFKHKNVINYRHIVMKPEELLYKHREHIKKFSIHMNIDEYRFNLNDKEASLIEHRDEMKMQESFGILKLDDSKEYYKYTLLGATRSVLILLFHRLFNGNALTKSES